MSITVYEVIYDSKYPGPAGDGTCIFRTRELTKAKRFVEGKTHYGQQATIVVSSVPMRLIRRWGI